MTAIRFFPALALAAVSFATARADAAPLLLAQATDDGGRPIRQIAPEIVAPPAVDAGELEREAPREPLSELGTAGPPERARARGSANDAGGEGTARPQFFRPVATAAGRMEAEGLTIVIAGIEVLEPERLCSGDDGDWPCGMVARTAFRSFLRGRALDCDLPDGELPAMLTASCRVGSQDLGAWLVSNGWAKVSSTGPYGEEQAEAVEARRGMFGTGPAPLPPSPVPGGDAAPAGAMQAPTTAAPPLVDAAPAAEPEPSVIERRPLPEPKGLY
ncbi:thermonuclease family protein [Aquibium microcysteis]|uniref:thermonuclease family protein n=1 Tax=Aquibium microcysteis TaxID=675281 RepID=UPI00165D0B1A|nr:thermonuclease family protein [Aquibium microcysteis]